MAAVPAKCGRGSAVKSGNVGAQRAARSTDVFTKYGWIYIKQTQNDNLMYLQNTAVLSKLLSG
jgi:hypothetical protein